MQEAIGAYRSITATSEFREMERLRSKARHDEAQALYHAETIGEERGIRIGEQRGEKREREKWQGVVADKDAEIAKLRAMLAETP
jgi:hypothetical protein